jgi:hypothetical protein
MGLEWGPLSLMSIIEDLLEWKSSGSGSRKIEINGRGDPLRRPRDILKPQELALTSPTCGGRSVGIFRLLTKATEFSFIRSRRGVSFTPRPLYTWGKALGAHFIGSYVVPRPIWKLCRREISLAPAGN